jgi:hypothetical protein
MMDADKLKQLNHAWDKLWRPGDLMAPHWVKEHLTLLLDSVGVWPIPDEALELVVFIYVTACKDTAERIDKALERGVHRGEK